MKSTSLLALLAVMLASPASAQTPPPANEAEASAVPKISLTPGQLDHIMRELEKVEAQIGQGRTSVLSAALAKFKAALASETAAVALYLDCYKLENFERKDLKQTDFMEWRDRNEERLKDDNFTKALLFQLEYLVMTIQAQSIDDPKKLGTVVPALQAFLAKEIVAVQETMKHTASGAVQVKDNGGGKGGRGPRGGGGDLGGASPLAGMLRQSVKSTEFSRAFKLDDHLKSKQWEYSPLNIAGIYSNVIFPYYLAEKPEELAAQWDARINAEMNLRKSGMSETEFNILQAEELPRLQWEKDSYLLTNNINAINALADMLKIIQNNPSHPDASRWLEEFKNVIKAVMPPPPVEKPIGSQ
ncbi:hypothetical protein [Prosthecobacter sp.]|jgi:hypothetical protein|uniref:hypothetical protein n=1 Tax=Prosthecobacter sp. TaxID=1965333 RepID=UPI003783C514